MEVKAYEALIQTGVVGSVAALAIAALYLMQRLHLALYREIILDQKAQILALTKTIADSAKLKAETLLKQADIIASMTRESRVALLEQLERKP